ncbi:MAG: hypothetical protein PUG70_00890 [Lachnospiraceae bacterium]|nr:hypothetical protein [Lachnospiraceae bacterium]MDY5521655.1 hypothetical protein [Agathobacter sp.]
MKNKVFTKITAMALALVMAVSPVTADAAEKKVVTNDDYKAVCDSFWEGKSEDDQFNDELWMASLEGEYDYVKSLNGYYNEKDYKVVTALDGTTKKLTKTGKYDVIVGGKTADTDQGYVKFVAPKSGTYKFTFTVKNTITNDSILIMRDGGNAKNFKIGKVNYTTLGGDKVTKSDRILLTPSGKCSRPDVGSYLDYQSGRSYSTMKTITATVPMKKGQTLRLVCRSCGANYNEDDDEAYNFTDFNLTIKKTK